MNAGVNCEKCKRAFKNETGLKKHKCNSTAADDSIESACVTEAPRGLLAPTKEHPIVSGMYDSIECRPCEDVSGGSANSDSANSDSANPRQPMMFTPITVEETAGMTQDKKLQWALDKIQALSDEIIKIRQRAAGFH